jgi:hypothetical protein
MDARNNGKDLETIGASARTGDEARGGVRMITLTQELAAAEVARLAAAAGVAKGRRRAGRAGAERVRLAQPLLFIAAGGTGRQLATRTKVSFMERLGCVPENAVFLAFDSAEDPITVRESGHGRVIELDPNGEFFRFERVPLMGIKLALERHPDIAARLGESLFHIHRASIHDGTAQERPQGLLALLWNAPMVVKTLNNAVRRLVERTEDLGSVSDGKGGVNLVVAGSSCGGQNSGAMLDLAYLARESLMGLGDLGESSRMIGVVVLPGAFPGVRGPNFAPNTYAFFLELDRLMQGGGFHASYPGNIRVDSMEAPFDTVFVLDGVDEHGKTWANLEEVCGLGGQALGLLLASDVGMREIFTAVNEQGVLHATSAAGFGTYLSTMGQAVIRFPAQGTADRCDFRLAVHMADACLSSNGKAPQGPASTAGMLRDRLRLNANGAPFETQIVLPSNVDGAAAEDQPSLVRTYIKNYLERRVYVDMFGQIKETAAALAGEMCDEMRGDLAVTLAGGRLGVISEWLRQRMESLQADYAGLLAEAERLAAESETGQKALDAAGVAMDQAADSLFFWRKAQVRAAVSRYVDEATQFARTRLEQRVAEAAAEVTQSLVRDLRAPALQANEAAIRLGQARELLATREAELAQLGTGSGEINLAVPELFDQLYVQHSADPLELLRQAAALGDGVLNWGTLSAEDLAHRLAQTADQAFKPLREISVEDVLAIRWDDRSAQQWIGRLAELAGGAWNLDRALLPDGGAAQASFLTIGVPDATDSIFANCGHTLVSTHDPERIVVLRTVYGASFDTLKPAPGWKRAYDRAAQRMPLHVLAAPANKP